MQYSEVQKIVEVIQDNKIVFILAGLIVSTIIFQFTKKSSFKSYFEGSALQQAGKKGFQAKLLEKKKLSHDTYEFIFDLPQKNQTLGIDVGQHITLIQEIEGEEVVRKYTPTSFVSTKGQFNLVIKVYRKNIHPKFPEGGKLTQWMEDKLQVGDKVLIKGPVGRLKYQGNGNVQITEFGEKPVYKQYKRIFLVGGGTGITPLYQVAQAIQHSQGTDKTQVYMLDANKAEEDILIQKELEQFYTDKIFQKLSYTLDNPPQDWEARNKKDNRFFKGFISQEMLQGAFPAYDKDTLICTCGPGPMNQLVAKLFKEQNYTDANIFFF